MEQKENKGKIIFAWILLILLIISASSLVYLKNNYKFKEDNNTTVIETPSASVTAALTNITSNINQNDKIEELNLRAELNDTTITVFYTINDLEERIDYVYDSDSHTLSSTNVKDNKDINDKIFKIIVIACQERLSNTENLDELIDSFIDETKLVEGLSKIDIGDNYIYKIDIITNLANNIKDTTDNKDEEGNYTNTETQNTSLVQ